jgi:uncharacterized membrane protein YgdD (TMEM256/DUF423 family)
LTPRVFVVAGALSGAVGVGLGAFAAHALRGRLSPEMLSVFEVGVRYHLYHALALVLCGWATTRWPGAATTAAAWCFLGGTVVFSGTLYLLAITGQRWLGAITPLGGLAFIAGWLSLAFGAWSAAR